MTIRTLAAPCGAALLALSLLVPAPAEAQTGSLWHNQKMNDMKAHERGSQYDERAGQHFQMALQYMGDMQRLLREERTPRLEKKLQKAYAKAVKNFEQALEAEPEWVDAYVMLGSAHYKMQDYPAAKSAYESALSHDPENQDVQAYLATVQYYLDNPDAEAPAGGGG